MAVERVASRLPRVRPPKVHLTYDVQVGDTIEKREIPFVVGVLADLSFHPDSPLPRLKDRKFISVDKDNFDDVMHRMRSRVIFRVNNKFTDDDSLLSIELVFKQMSDFEPQNVARQVQPLSKLLELRRKLVNLRSSLYGNDRLEEMLQRLTHNPEQLHQLANELGLDARDQHDE
jgi:type VI secretion system protein ImpB